MTPTASSKATPKKKEDPAPGLTARVDEAVKKWQAEHAEANKRNEFPIISGREKEMLERLAEAEREQRNARRVPVRVLELEAEREKRMESQRWSKYVELTVANGAALLVRRKDILGMRFVDGSTLIEVKLPPMDRRATFHLTSESANRVREALLGEQPK